MTAKLEVVHAHRPAESPNHTKKNTQHKRRNKEFKYCNLMHGRVLQS